MDCSLCKRPIERYDPSFHHLKIPPSIELDICDACTDAFLKWHGEKLARLFPTKALKERFGSDTHRKTRLIK